MKQHKVEPVSYITMFIGIYDAVEAVETQYQKLWRNACGYIGRKMYDHIQEKEMEELQGYIANADLKQLARVLIR